MPLASTGSLLPCSVRGSGVSSAGAVGLLMGRGRCRHTAQPGIKHSHVFRERPGIAHPYSADSAYDCRQDSRSGDRPMQAIVYHRYGSPDVLELEEIPKPTPAEGQVLIRVHAAHQKCTPTYASGFDPYSTVFSSGNSYTFATSAFAPILIAGLSSK